MYTGATAQLQAKPYKTAKSCRPACITSWTYRHCNHENKFLVQQRSFQKQYFPGIWDVTGGRVQAGETKRQGAVREAWEEVGLRFREGTARPCRAYRDAMEQPL